MTIEDVERYCLSLKAAVAERPFGPSLLVFKVGGKIFALLNEAEANVSFKASDIANELLREQGRARRAPYLPRGGWLNVEQLATWDQDELNDLIHWSYQRVTASLTRQARKDLGL
ncbi:MAG: MmcQ/YjbR family DNA-binding protein [Janthinobacterium lividum]